MCKRRGGNLASWKAGEGDVEQLLWLGGTAWEVEEVDEGGGGGKLRARRGIGGMAGMEQDAVSVVDLMERKGSVVLGQIF